MIGRLYDQLAPHYDQELAACDESNRFPYAGYRRTLAFVARELAGLVPAGRAAVLDLGIGTGLLETMLAPEAFALTGVDLSGGMLELARLRHPAATLLVGDFTRELPEPPAGGWDAIVATYALHHLPLADFVMFLERLAATLSPCGRIVVGDILFLDDAERAAARRIDPDGWEDEEHYHAYDEVLERVRGRYALSFAKTSWCAGVLLLGRFHELNAPAETRVKCGR